MCQKKIKKIDTFRLEEIQELLHVPRGLSLSTVDLTFLVSTAGRGYLVPDRVGRGESDYLASSPYLTRTPPLLSCSFTVVLQSAMNGFDSKGLDEDAFGEKSALSGLKTFDAFRESPLLERYTCTDTRSANQPQTLPNLTTITRHRHGKLILLLC